MNIKTITDNRNKELSKELIEKTNAEDWCRNEIVKSNAEFNQELINKR